MQYASITIIYQLLCHKCVFSCNNQFNSGKTFFVGLTPKRLSTLIKIVTSQDNTKLKIGTVDVNIVSKGNTYTARLTAATKITADKPILLVQVCLPRLSEVLFVMIAAMGSKIIKIPAMFSI